MFYSKGLYMTITVWESRDAMREFYHGPAHFSAMTNTNDVGRYAKVHGYYTVIQMSSRQQMMQFTNGEMEDEDFAGSLYQYTVIA